MPLVESSIRLDFPDNNYFRFENCEGYRSIQNHFSEMDVCWFDQTNDLLYIIELKDWKSNNLSEEGDPSISAEKIEEMKNGISKYRINNLLKKSIDSISMFMSILLEKPYSSFIQSCSPFTISATTQIKLLTIINWTNPDITYISTINQEYKARFRPYAKLYDVKTHIVLTKDQAKQYFAWIS